LNENSSTKAKYDTVKNELKSHGHPSTRIMPNGNQRNIEEARSELLRHYESFHKSFFI
jgi:hypothetical protein